MLGNNTPVRNHATASVDLGRVGEWLEGEHYEAIAELLDHVLTASDQQGYEPHILLAVAEISRSCGQSLDEANWHKHAFTEANRRKDELRQVLRTILNLFTLQEKNIPANGLSVSQNLSPERIAESAQHWKLWQSVQGLIKTHSFEEEKPTVLSLPADSFTGQPTLIVYFLGPFEVYGENRRLEEWPSRKGKLIFKYLVTHRKRRVPKEVLMDLFWPNVDPEAARNNLNVAIYNLRQTLRHEPSDLSHILFQDDCYFITPDLYIWTDFETFLDHFRRGQQFEQHGQAEATVREYCAAEALYRGAFLEEDSYEEWPISNRQHLERVYYVVLEHLSSYYLDERNYGLCVTICSKMLASDPCREDAHERLMRCYSRQNQPYLALRQYHVCVESLKKDLNASPSPPITALYEQILAGDCV